MIPYYTDRPEGFSVHPSEIYENVYDALLRGEISNLQEAKELVKREFGARLGRTPRGIRWHKMYTDMVRQALRDYQK